MGIAEAGYFFTSDTLPAAKPIVFKLLKGKSVDDLTNYECVLQGYKVYYTLTPDLPIALWTVHEVEGRRLTTIPNLLTNRTYTLKALAYTAVGDGPLSEEIQVKLQHGGIVGRRHVVVLCFRML